MHYYKHKSNQLKACFTCFAVRLPSASAIFCHRLDSTSSGGNLIRSCSSFFCDKPKRCGWKNNINITSFAGVSMKTIMQSSQRPTALVSDFHHFTALFKKKGHFWVCSSHPRTAHRRKNKTMYCIYIAIYFLFKSQSKAGMAFTDGRRCYVFK